MFKVVKEVFDSSKI